ncbi:putative membrane protein YedE/YeeE [Oxalobacteraceae bacterium GrIS 2.11]
MNIDWNHFTPYASLLGGMLLGVSTALLILLNGRIAGVSGVLGGFIGNLLRGVRADNGWRSAFVIGIVGAPAVYSIFARLPELEIGTGYGAIVAAGLLVGIGTRYGSGCTSGHGISGLARLSPRSMVATMSFMLAGFVTVFFVRHLIAF